MNEKLAKLKEWWGGLEENSKRMIVVVPLILAFVLYVMPRSVTSQIGGYKALYKNIDIEKASAAATYLDDKGIQYQLKDNGKSIYVARDVDANRLKLALAEQDILPREEMPGNRLLIGGSSFGEGEEAIKVKKKIALEQNLAAIISSYEQIKDAKVLITSQEKSAFVRTSQPAKASVTLTLKRGESLQGDQVKGITRIVANAVPGLVPDKVAITDQYGNPLSQVSLGSSSIGKATQQLEYQAELEKRLEDKAQTALNRVIGPSQASVVVNAELYMEETIRRSRIVDPENRVKEEEMIVEIQDRRGAPGGMGGFPGTDTNISERLPLLRQALGNEDRKETRKTIKYKLNETMQIDKILPGEIKRLAVALTISEKVQLYADEDKEVKGKEYKKGEFIGWEKRKVTDVQRIEDLVKAMVGFNEERGDVFTTQMLAFYDNRDAPPLLLPPFWKKYFAEGVVSLLGVLTLASLVALWRSKIKTVNKYKEELKLAEAPNVQVSMEIQKLASNIVHNPKVIADALQSMIEDKPIDQAMQDLGPADKVEQPAERVRNRAAIAPTVMPSVPVPMETVAEPEVQSWSPPPVEEVPTAVQPAQAVQQPIPQQPIPQQPVQQEVVREEVQAEQVPAE
jgi:flagellar M-ring protein FliF